MAEPFTLVATVHPAPGQAKAALESYREVTPLVHQEQGCELYAVHLSQDGETIVVIERWTTHADLRAHNEGAAIARLQQLSGGLLAAPTDILLLDEVPLGDPTKGTLT